MGWPDADAHHRGGLNCRLLPIGILALGRRSNMPLIKSLCVVYIEFWRGSPDHGIVHGLGHVTAVYDGGV